MAHELCNDVDVEHLAKEGAGVSTAGMLTTPSKLSASPAMAIALFRGRLVADSERLAEQALRLGCALCKACQRRPIAIDGRHLPTRVGAAQPLRARGPTSRRSRAPPCPLPPSLWPRLSPHRHLLGAPTSGAGPSHFSRLAARQDPSPISPSPASRSCPRSMPGMPRRLPQSSSSTFRSQSGSVNAPAWHGQ
jgi:hypothetical protein